MIAQIALATIFLVGANCYLNKEYIRPSSTNELEDIYSKQPLSYKNWLLRLERDQVHGLMNNNPDGTANVMAKLSVDGNDKNTLSAVGGLGDVKSGGVFGAESAGVALNNFNKIGAPLDLSHIPQWLNIDYSAMGIPKYVYPFIPSRFWPPSFESSYYIY